MRKLVIIISVLLVLLVAGCATQTIEQEVVEDVSSEETEDVEIVKPCPESCDDGDDSTVDTCGEETGYECVSVKKEASLLVEDVMRDVNDALNVDYLYVEEDSVGKVKHYAAKVDPEKKGLIVIDVVEYSLADEMARIQYFDTQFDNYFMGPIEDSRGAQEKYLSEREYYFEGKGYYGYVNHTTTENVRYDNLTLVDGVYESAYGSIDISEVNIKKEKEDFEYAEKMFFINVPFNYRLSKVCGENIVVHLYPVVEEYNVEEGNNFVRTQEESYILNRYRDVQEDMMKKVEKLADICE